MKNKHPYQSLLTPTKYLEEVAVKECSTASGKDDKRRSLRRRKDHMTFSKLWLNNRSTLLKHRVQVSMYSGDNCFWSGSIVLLPFNLFIFLYRIMTYFLYSTFQVLYTHSTCFTFIHIQIQIYSISRFIFNTHIYYLFYSCKSPF